MCAFLSQSMNQFSQTPILGLVDMIPSPNVVTAQILTTSVATAIQNGSVLKLVDGGSNGGPIIVDVVTGPTDGPVYGAIPYAAKKNIYKAGDFVEVALDSSFIFMKASAAVARGAQVVATAATTSADPTVATVSDNTTQFVTGVAQDKATAANQLIRVRIQPNLTLVPAGA